MKMRILRCFLLSSIPLLFSVGTLSFAQIANVTDDTSTPIEGAGHDYIKMLSETVNPANGSVSLRIQAPTPKGRGITIPFSFSYDSGGVQHLQPALGPNGYGSANWVSNLGYLSQGGWHYGVPLASTSFWSSPQGAYPNFYTCLVYSNYLFSDGSGSQHSLGLGSQYNAGNSCPEPNFLSGGDQQVAAWLIGAGFTWGVGVSAADGTVYTFNSLAETATDYNWQYYGLVSSIEDRNGNIITAKDNGNGSFVFTDTAGRTVISSNGFGPSGHTNTLTFSGLTYQVTWTTVNASFSTTTPIWVGPAGEPDSYDNCTPPGPGTVSNSQTVISQITLPNQTSYYKFYYGTEAAPHNTHTNPYGMLSEIDYPTGGWVAYTWKLSDNPNELADFPGVYNAGDTCPDNYCPAPVPDGCLYLYSTPVVASRSVGFGASSSPSQTQTFFYSTTWGSSPAFLWTEKDTSVTSTDAVTGESSLTKYSYSPIPAPGAPYIYYGNHELIPVEHVTSVYDWGNTTTPLQTHTKYWYDQFNLASDTTEVGSTLMSEVVYCYAGSNCTPNAFSQLKTKSEYGHGSGAVGPLLRQTTNTYQAFSGTPGHIADAPCKTVIYDGSGNRYAETDYLYDGNSTLCGTVSSASTTTGVTVVSGTHDESNFGPAKTTPRGNVTTKTQWLNTGSSPVTTYSYYETGQVRSMTEPCGNGTCSDMTGTSYTTNYYYSDSYTTGSNTCSAVNGPAGNTNALLTTIVYPPANGIVHSECFSYDYNSGQLTGLKDENGQLTTYAYNDPFYRPTQATYPDTGGTTISYNDTAPSPTVTTTKLISTSQGVNFSTTKVMDGVGHVVQTQVTTDPETTDYVDTSYYGTGQVRTRSNPYRSSSSPTDGTTTYGYDGIGRTTVVAEPDGSAVATAYSGNCPTVAYAVTVTDETGKLRVSCSDALGRLTAVEEPGVGATLSTAGSGTVTIGGSEQTDPGTPGKGTATLSSSLACVSNDHGGYYPPMGTVWISVTGVNNVVGTGSSGFGGSCDGSYFTMSPTLNQIAASIAGGLTNSGAGVTATSNGYTIQITANGTGSGTNYPVYSNYTTNVNNYEVSASVPATLTGGSSAISDSGSVSVTVDGFTASSSYGSGSTAQQIASTIASALNSGSPVEASLNGTVITLTATDPGSDSNYILTTFPTWNTTYFPSPSFTATPSGATLTGGTDGTLGNSPLVTQYAYDPLNNLTCAVQKGTDTTPFTTCAAASSTWRPRSFAYDSLSRLTSATNPESGNITYQYDLNGNLSSKGAPLPNVSSGTVTTNYQYDVLNRLTGKTYTGMNMPNILFGYDGIATSGCSPQGLTDSYPVGRRTSMCDGSGVTLWSHDPMGRVSSQMEKQTGGGTNVTESVSYGYNLDGSLNKLKYPSGNTVSYTVGGAGRVTQVSDASNSYAGPSVNSPMYAPQGAPANVTYGYTGTLGIVTSNSYNNRLQPAVLSAANPSQTIFSLSYGFNLGNDNGNVQQIVNNLDSTRSLTFTYDVLNRISQAYTTWNPNSNPNSNPNCWGETYTIDSWGNLTNISGPSGMTGCNSHSLNNPVGTNNQTTTFCYDGAGNLLDMGACASATHSYVYDAEGQLQSPPVAGLSTGLAYTYFYDGDGNRVQKCDANPCTSGTTLGTLYWRGPGGEVLDESSRTGSMLEEYVFFNGQRIARRDLGTGNVHYYFSDHLGSVRLITDSGGIIEQQTDYFPYGGVAYTSGTDENHYKFTGKERDAESNLDYFEARYDASSLGRFMTPDPMGGHLENPQSLNKYAYVLNNPTSLTDPTGLDSYLSCTQTKDNASTCQSQTVGYDANGKAQTATVQGVTGDNGFTATKIGNQNADGTGPLVDKTTGTGTYTASANGGGVQFSNNGGQSSSTGVFVNGTPQTTFQDAGFANGNALSGFTFTLTNSKLEAGQTEAGSFTFAGTPDQAGAALQKAGFNPRSGENVGMNEYRSPGSFWTGANSAHFNVFQIGLKPWLAVPQAQGDMHFGEHDPRSVFGGPIHFREWRQ